MRCRFLLLAAAASCGMFPSSCTREDEELQSQLIEVRAALDSKTKSLEQLQSQMAELQSQKQHSSSGSGEELAKAKSRITELTSQLETAKAQSGSPATTLQPMKLDLDVMAEKLEEDLDHKSRQLRDLVKKQAPDCRIATMTRKAVEFPPQLITPFSTTIALSVETGQGRQLNLVFPVTADLSGSWKLPTPDQVQSALRQAETGNVPVPGVASTNPSTPQSAGQQSTAAPGGNMPRVRQIDANTFYMDPWGDAAGGNAQASAQAPRAPQPALGAPQTFNNFTPPGQTAPQPQQPAAPGPAAPAPAAPQAPQAPSVPPPVMPVVGDRIIRFND